MDKAQRGDLEKITRAVEILFAPVKLGAGECIEIRTFNKQKKLVAAGWYDNLGIMAKHVYRMAQEGYGCYRG